MHDVFCAAPIEGDPPSLRERSRMIYCRKNPADLVTQLVLQMSGLPPRMLLVLPLIAPPGER